MSSSTKLSAYIEDKLLKIIKEEMQDHILTNERDIESVINEMKNRKIHGINVTVPYKKKVIPFVDELSVEASKSQSVNTIYFQNEKIIGHNTDISGFELGIKYSKYDIKKKVVLILGAGGVVSSIIIALKKNGSRKNNCK